MSKPGQTDFEREERRSIVALGLLAIALPLASPNLKLTIWIWTVNAGNILYALAFLWALYAACTLIYLSDDGIFSEGFRIRCHRWSLAFLFAYPFFVLYSVAGILVSFSVAIFFPEPFTIPVAVILALITAIVMAIILGRFLVRIFRWRPSTS